MNSFLILKKSTQLQCMIPAHWILILMTLLFMNLDHTNAANSIGKFVPIFDRKSLEGWSPSFPEAAEAWYVHDGYIVGEGVKGRCYLIYDGNRDIADFELKFSYRFPGKGNSGVNIRAVEDPSGNVTTKPIMWI